LLHNFFFPDTAYELLGFTINSDVLFAVVKQRFVKATAQTDLQLLKNFLASNGFINSRNNDYYHPQLGIILEDLYDENVLTKDGVLHFIDTVFYIQNEFYKD
jgi:Serine/Threonine/Tyrosine Kinase found in polyvalent proteins